MIAVNRLSLMKKIIQKIPARQKKRSTDNLLWLDLEMTGLDPARCTILEIGAAITSPELELITESPVIAVHHSEHTLSSMEPWSQRHHEKSGLIGQCRRSRVSLKKAELAVIRFVKAHFAPKTARLCGNSIWQDRRFLTKYMPKLDAYLFYRMIDVSTIKELVSRWYPGTSFCHDQKLKTHRVLDDIRESIAELKFYRDNIFVRDRLK